VVPFDDERRTLENAEEAKFGERVACDLLRI
jgi:hypothetical protein